MPDYIIAVMWSFIFLQGPDSYGLIAFRVQSRFPWCRCGWWSDCCAPADPQALTSLFLTDNRFLQTNGADYGEIPYPAPRPHSCRAISYPAICWCGQGVFRWRYKRCFLFRYFVSCSNVVKCGTAPLAGKLSGSCLYSPRLRALCTCCLLYTSM